MFCLFSMFGDLTVAKQARLLAVVKSSGDEDFRGYANGVELRVSRGLVRRINTQRGCAHGQARGRGGGECTTTTTTRSKSKRTNRVEREREGI